MAAKKTQGKKRSGSSGKNTSAKRKTPVKKGVKAKKTSNPLTREITFLVLLVFSILSLLSLFQMCGIFGRGLSSVLFGLMGALAYLFPIYLIVSAGLYIANTDNIKEVDFQKLMIYMINGEACMVSVRAKAGLKKLMRRITDATDY